MLKCKELSVSLWFSLVLLFVDCFFSKVLKILAGLFANLQIMHTGASLALGDVADLLFLLAASPD